MSQWEAVWDTLKSFFIENEGYVKLQRQDDRAFEKNHYQMYVYRWGMLIGLNDNILAVISTALSENIK